jgi:uncharacterized membrane protein YbhN (UPF0104 family)
LVMIDPTRRRWAVLALKIAVSAALLGLVLSQANAAANYSSILLSLSPTTIAIVVAIVVLQIAVISAWRLKLVMQLLGCRLGAVDAARIAWSGFFAEQVGAFFVAGDVVRIWLLRRADLPLTTAVAGPFLDRAIGLSALVALASFGAPRLWWNLDSGLKQALLIAAGMAVAGLASIAGFVLLSPWLRSWIARALGRLRAFSTSTLGAFGHSARSRIAAVVSLALLIHCSNVVAINLLLSAVGVKLGLAACFVLIPTVLLLSMMPASVSGWGVREAAMVLALRGVNAPPEAIVAASALFGICVLTASLPGAFIWLHSRSEATLPDRFRAPAPASDPVELRS